MAITGVSQCPACKGVINIRWKTCPNCSRPLTAETPPDWTTAWRQVARMTDGIEETHPHLEAINDLLGQMDIDFLSNQWPAFQANVLKLQTLCGRKS